MALLWADLCPDIIVHRLCFLYDHRCGHPACTASLSNTFPKRDCHQYPIGNTNHCILSQQYACPDGYRAADNGHIDRHRHHRASTEPDAPAKRYALGHLDTEHNAHQYQYPDAHPNSIGNFYPFSNLDTQPERYPLAGPNPNQIKYARDYCRS
jgi:hypothetical protein